MEEHRELISDNYVVTQSNSLIEADYSKAKLPARTLKIARLIIAKLKPDDLELREIPIKHNHIRQYLGYSPTSNYNRFKADLKEVCRQLNAEPIQIQTARGTDFNAYFISSFEIDLQNDETIFEISGKLKPYLLELQSNFTSYQLRNIPMLNSSYSIRVYELLYQYKRIGKRRFEVEDFKRKIGCHYPMYGHVKKRAILKAQSDLEEFTDLKFEFEEIKKGRKITEIIFYIYMNDPDTKNDTQQELFNFLDDEISGDSPEPFPEQIAKAFVAIGISASNLQNMIGQGFDIIEDEAAREAAQKRCRTISQYYIEKLTLLDQSKAMANPAGFFIKALREDWKSPELFRKIRTSKAKAEKARLQRRLNWLEKTEDKLQREFRQKRQEIVDNHFEANADEFEEIYNAIENIPGSIIQYKKPGFSPEENYQKSIFLKEEVNKRLRDSHPEMFAPLVPLSQKLDEIKEEIKQIKGQP